MYFSETMGVQCLFSETMGVQCLFSETMGVQCNLVKQWVCNVF